MVSLFMEEGTVTIHKTWICHFELIECVPNKLGNCINYPTCILRFNFTGFSPRYDSTHFCCFKTLAYDLELTQKNLQLYFYCAL